MSTVPSLATWADIARMPEGTRAEILDGEVVVAPSPTPAHQYVAGGIASELDRRFRRETGPRGWWILQEVDVEMSAHRVVQPDVAGWRRERVSRFPAERPIRVVPDWACEVVSPSSAREDRIRKAAIYLESGVPFYWIVDPEQQVLEAFEAGDGKWVRLGAWTAGDVARIAPFEAIDLDVGGLFPPGEPEAGSG